MLYRKYFICLITIRHNSLSGNLPAIAEPTIINQHKYNKLILKI